MQRLLPTGARSPGFTLIELVVVMAILTLLAGMAVPAIQAIADSERKEATEKEMEAIHEAALLYAEDTGIVPSNLDRLYADAAIAGWGGPYIDDMYGGNAVAGEGFRNDAWRQAYTWTVQGRIATLTSRGPNRVSNNGNGDDIRRQVDITPVLRAITKKRMDTINTSITRYNAVNFPAQPLPGTSNALIAQLQSQGYLPAGSKWFTDAFGAAWVPSPQPVVSVGSSNFGSGQTGPADGGRVR